MKKFLKISSYILGSILLIILLLLAFTQTGWFKDIAKGYAEDIANESLNATLTIGEITGSIFGDLQISDIRITQENSTFFYCKKAALDYDLSGILFSEVDINFIFVDSVYVNLKQLDDSTWNAATLTKPSGEIEEPDTSAGSFDWKISLGKFELKRSAIAISTIDSASAIPKKIDQFNIAASAFIGPDVKKLKIDRFNFVTDNPYFELKNILVNTEMNNDQIEIKDFNVETGENKIYVSGNYYLNDGNTSTINLKTEPISFNEFRAFAPSFDLNGNPILEIYGSYQNSSVLLKASITENDQKLLINGKAESIDAIPEFLLSVNFENINAGYWLKDSSMSTDLNSKLRISGSGKELENLTVNSELLIYDSQLLKRNLDTLKLNSKFESNNIKGDISLASGFGSIDGDFEIIGITDTREYNLELNIDELNTAPVLLNDSLTSNINFTVNINGEKFDPEKLAADISFKLGSSSFTDYSIDTIFTNVSIRNGIYKIDTLVFENSAAGFKSGGIVSLNNEIDFNFRLDINDLSSLPQLSNLENFNVDGYISGSAGGTLDSLSAIIQYQLSNFTLQTNSAEKVNGELNISRISDSLNAAIETKVENILASEIKVRDVDFEARYFDNTIDSKLSVDVNDSLSLLLASSVKLDSLISIALTDLDIQIDNYLWQNQNDSTLITVGESQYQIENFYLSNGDQFIQINGLLDPESDSNLELKINDFDAGEFIRAVKPDISASAIINTEINFKGSISNPSAVGKLQITDVNYAEYNIGNISSNFNLAEEKFKWDLELDRLGHKVFTTGYLPLKFDAEENQSVIPGDELLSINLKIDSLDLSSLPKFNSKLDKLTGKINSDLTIHNTLNNLKAEGFFSIDETQINSTAYGITFDDFNFRLEADSQKIYLKKINMVNGEGSLKIEGFAGYPGGLLSNKLDPLEITLNADEFEIAKTRNYEATIDGDLKFTNSAGEGTINGNITVLRSRFYLPYFTEAASEKEYNTNKPLLMREIEAMRAANDTIIVKDSLNKRDSLKSPPFLKNLKGRFTLSIPKNTWLIAPQFNMELSGDIDVVKESEHLELFGNVNVVRGKIEIYGKEFEVVEGRIILNGGRKLNPRLVMSLEYMFRDSDKSKKYLQLSVRGTAEKPELEFSLDGNKVDEGNAISYILFGRSLDELTQSQKSGVNSSKEDLAKNLAGSLLASQLSSTLGEAFGLDVIEIKGGENWKRATVTAGKYLTNDLYVGYERGFGSAEPNEVQPRIVTLEYELTPFLFFQLVEGNDKTTGFDAIFKFNW